MKKVLITGAKGFIGKTLEGTPFIGDICNYKEVSNSSKNMIGIVHLAAKSNRRKCEQDVKACIQSNLLGLCNILEVALKKKIWVLFISTFQVKERNIYGLSKLMGEEVCRLYQKKGVKVRILRLPIVYGLNDKTDKIVTKMINELKLGIEPTITTKDKFYFLYVGNVARVIEKEVAILNGNFGKAYTLTTLINGIKECLNAKEK